MDNQKLKSSVAMLSVVSNATLVALKVVIGIAIGSVSVISEAIHSGVDLVAAVIAYVAVKTGGKPADEEHPFGHGKIENISGTVEAVLIFVAAGWIIYEAIKKLIAQQEIKDPNWGVGVMAASAVVNLIVSHLLFRVGKKTDSIALQADGWHLRTDVYTSVGVMAGLGIIWLGDKTYDWTGLTIFQHLHWVDPLAAMAVAVLIIHAAWKLTRESAAGLLDTTLPVDEERRIQGIVAGFTPRVRGFHRMRTRKAGPQRFVEFHIFVDGRLSVRESHELTHDIAERIREAFPSASVIIHVEPCLEPCPGSCTADCLLDDDGRRRLGPG